MIPDLTAEEAQAQALAQLQGAQAVHNQLLAPDTTDQFMASPEMNPPQMSMAPPAVGPPGAPVAAVPDQAPPMLAAPGVDPNAGPMPSGKTLVKRVIPNFGDRSTDPSQIVARNAGNARKEEALLDQAGHEKQEGLALTQEADKKDAVATGIAADANAAEGRTNLVAQDQEQAHQAVIQAEQEGKLNEDIAAHKEMYKQDPTKWWANHTGGSRLGALLSMIGAGMKGEDTTHMLNDLIDRDTAELARKEGNLDKLSGMNQKLGNMRMKGSADKMANLQARHVAAKEVVVDELKARLASTGDIRAQANYKDEIAKMQLDIAKQKASITDHRTQTEMQASQLQQSQDSMTTNAALKEELRRDVAAKDPKGGALRNLPGFEGVDGQPGATYGNLAAPTQKYLQARETSIKASQHIRQILDTMPDARKDPRGFAAAVERIGQMQTVQFDINRALTGSGAALNKIEEENLKKLGGTWQQFLMGKVTGVKMQEMLKLTERLYTEQAMAQVNEVAPYMHRAKPGSTWYDVQQDQKKDEAAGKEQEAYVQRVMNGRGSDDTKLDLLESISSSNPFAAQAVEQMKSNRSEHTIRHSSENYMGL